VYGYTDFLIPRVQCRLQRWLYALCWTGTDRPSVLFERATTWLLSHKGLRPGVSVLERLVARLRPRVEARGARVLTRGRSPAQQTQLTTLLHVPPGSRASTCERLRRGPIRQSVPALRAALRRLEEVRTLGLTVPSAGRVPPARLQSLARFAATTRRTALQRLAGPRQLATLLAFLHTLEATAQDDVLDLVDSLRTDLFAEAGRPGQKARLRTLKDLETAADRLRHACAVLFDVTLPEGQVRTAAFAAVPRETLAEARHQVDRLVRPPDEVDYPALQASYRRVRRFLPPLLRTMTFAASPAGPAVVDALGYLRHVEAPRSQAPLEPPLAVVTPRWRRYVVRAADTVAPQAYTFCALDRFRAAVRRRELFVTPRVRYAAPRQGWLEGAAWTSARPLGCRALGQPGTAEEAITTLRQQLDQTSRTVAAHLPHNPAVRIETRRGKARLVLSPLEKLEEPPSLVALRAAVAARLPRVDVPELLLELIARTGLATAFTHVHERTAHVDHFAVSLCAVLLAEACNIGLEPLVCPEVPALQRARLIWGSQHDLRTETITEGNALLVAAQNAIPLVHTWGGGDVASADGLRFVVPVRTVHAGPNPKYYGQRQGGTYYHLVSDQSTGLHGLPVPGTLRDSLVLLRVLLEQPTELHPTDIMTDSGAYSDVIFGLFRLLGYRFMPR
jgi:hypothetical protein